MGTTDYLFPKPAAIYGLARLLDIAAQLDTYNTAPTGAIADAIAMYNDWAVVGDDVLAVLIRELESRLEGQAA